MKRNQIYIGSLSNPLYYFDNNTIMSANVVQNVALIGQELSIDTFSPVVRVPMESSLDVVLFRSSDGYTITVSNGQLYAVSVEESSDPSPLVSTPEGTPVWYFYEDDLVGKFYLESVARIAKTQYKLNCVSAIGRMDKMQHSGGLFLRATFGQVVKHILHGKPEV